MTNNKNQLPNDLETIEVDDITINVKRSTRRKTLSLEISTHGAIVRVPQKMKIRVIEEFIKSKRHWLKQHYENRPKPIEPIELKNGAVVKFLNENYALSILDKPRSQITIKNNNIIVPLGQTKTEFHKALKNKLIRWYKKQAQDCLRDKVLFFAEEMQIPLKKSTQIKVRDYKRRWGSCSHKGDLTFNWRIIMAPEEVLDYVAIHEIAHLKEFNHSKKFWNIVYQQCPEWQQQRDWLNEQGGSLYRF